jgi:hypothetical protein
MGKDLFVYLEAECMLGVSACCQEGFSLLEEKLDEDDE